MKSTITVTFEVVRDDEPAPFAFQKWVRNTLSKWADGMPPEVTNLYGIYQMKLIDVRSAKVPE